MTFESELAKIIAQIYASSLDDQLIPELLARIVGLSQGNSISLTYSGGVSHFVYASYDGNLDLTQYYKSYYRELYLSVTIFDKSNDHYLSSIKNTDGSTIIAIEMIDETNHSTTITIYYDKDATDNMRYEWGKQILFMLHPHFSQANNIKSRINSTSEISKTLANVMHSGQRGIILYNHSADIIFTSPNIHNLLSLFGDIVLMKNKLYFKNSDFESQYLKELRNAISANDARTPLSKIIPIKNKRNSSQGYFQVQSAFVAGYDLPNGSGSVRAITLISAEGALKINKAALFVLYGLTKTESKVAEHIAQGLDNNEIAHILDISIHTVRAHIKAVMGKCDVHSKSELVGLLLYNLWPILDSLNPGENNIQSMSAQI